MSDWGWVTLAYTVVFATLGAYVVSLVYRTRVLKERLEARSLEARR